MHFDPFTLENYITQDWTILLKILKMKEDYYCELLQHNINIIKTSRSDNENLFVKDEIVKHSHLLQKIINQRTILYQEEHKIQSKYQDTILSFEKIGKQMNRVCSRILEICHMSLGKTNHLDPTIQERLVQMQRVLIGFLNNKEGIKIKEIIEKLSNYSNKKLDEEIQRLKLLIQALEHQQYTMLSQIYLRRETKGQLKRHVQSKAIQQPIPKPLPNKIETNKTKQKIFKNLYSIMELSKHQCEEGRYSQEQRVSMLYSQSLNRNKLNNEQINEFRLKQDQLFKKTTIFKQNLDKECKKVQVIVKKAIRPKLSPKIEQVSFGLIDEYHFENIVTENNLDHQHIQKKYISPKISLSTAKKDLNNFSYSFKNYTNFPALQSTKFEFNPKNSRKRSNLPQIKLSTLDPKTEITRLKIERIIGFKKELHVDVDNAEEFNDFGNRRHQKIEKYSERSKIQINNIDLGIQLVDRKEQYAKTKFKQKISTSFREKTLAMRRSSVKFSDAKLNILS